MFVCMFCLLLFGVVVVLYVVVVVVVIVFSFVFCILLDVYFL